MKINMHSSAISDNSGGFILYFDVKQIRKNVIRKGWGLIGLLSHEKSLKFLHKIELSHLNVKLQGQKNIYNKINNKHLEFFFNLHLL